ncbi:3-phosphoshikimate 1-carboxyvinyltransferase [Clostridium sp.]|uniref:3-phosphoshikimate 1-carboxyvinyltransferase n=1 Tax=Clostridium sp. TaxID=1506 RepID=UPI003464D433
MNLLKINPRLLNGEVNIPPSKSMAHRAIICASLSNGFSTIENIDLSDDIIATIEGMKSMGAIINIKDKTVMIQGINTFEKKDITIDCNESGSTLRFLVPISIINENKVRFIGKGNLGKRPLKTYYDIFDEKHINYNFKENILDLTIEGRLKSGEYRVNGNISSQFISGLLFSLPLLEDASRLIITTELESRGYIDLTLSVMKDFGVDIENKRYREFIIKGNQIYKPRNYSVEGDYSQGAFFLCAGAIGNDIKCFRLNEKSLQGDKEVISILKAMGANIFNNEYIKAEKDNLKGTIIDGSQCPDIIPILTVVAALSEGVTIIENASRLRIKECDRLKAISTELNKIGANIIEKEDGLIINGASEFTGGEVYSWDDHRIAMALAIASTRCKESLIIRNPMCVKKSYPSFFEDFKALGGEYSYL